MGFIFAHQRADGSYLITDLDAEEPPFVVGFDPGNPDTFYIGNKMHSLIQEMYQYEYHQKNGDTDE